MISDLKDLRDGFSDYLKSFLKTHSSKVANLFVFFFLYFLFFILLSLLAPLLIQLSDNFLHGAGGFIYWFFSAFDQCHQLPERSLILFNQVMPFCARDLGIFLGILVSAIAAFWNKVLPDFLKSRWIIVVGAAPMVIDGVTQTILYLRESTVLLRFVTGFLFTFVLTYFIFSYIVNLTELEWKNFISKGKYGIVLFLIVSVGFIFVFDSHGQQFVSEAELVDELGLTDEKVYFLGGNAVYNIQFDPYLDTYNDVILSQVDRYSFDDPRHYGVWVVVKLDEGVKKERKVVFMSKTKGTYSYYDARNGELIFKRIVK